MISATRLGFVMLLGLWLTACAKDEGGLRPSFADGSTNATSNDTLSGNDDLDCQATPSAAEVVSETNFSVDVVFSNGTSPFEIVGFASGITTSRATVSGRVTLTGSADRRVTRRVLIHDAAGLTGSCSFQVVVRH